MFGYPLTDEVTEQGCMVQYFERQRFELHSENAPAAANGAIPSALTQVCAT